jgi:phosphoribosyl 1,2-cyclic phosphate phosphodiesterase
MKIKFLGTGTSHGVPLIGCGCAACSSKDKKNTRYRSSVHVEEGPVSILIDTPAEFRIRAIEYGIKRIDAVLMTHCHADHIAGLDDLRAFNELQDSEISVYGSAETLKEIKERFSYIFSGTLQEGGGKPRLNLQEIKSFEKFTIKNTGVMPLVLKHGVLDIFGFRIGEFAYLTDVSQIPQETYGRLDGLKVLVLDALRKKPHPTHFSLEQAIEEAKKIKAENTFFTHIAHSLEHNETNASLPEGIQLAYDGMEIEI